MVIFMHAFTSDKNYLFKIHIGGKELMETLSFSDVISHVLIIGNQ